MNLLRVEDCGFPTSLLPRHEVQKGPAGLLKILDAEAGAMKKYRKHMLGL